MRIAFVSRELYPLAGGGIGAYVCAAARALASEAEVTILTSAHLQSAYEQLRARDDPRLPPATVRIAFVAEPGPEDLAGWYDVMHWYGSRVLERLRELYPEGGPDVLEFPDFLAEGFVAVQAACALDRFFEGTCVCVRVHTSAEVTEVLNGFYRTDLSRQVVYAMERFALAHADRVIWPLGDVAEAYRRFYGARRLAPLIKIGYPYVGAVAHVSDDDADGPRRGVDRPLRCLFVGRLERRKGVLNLVRAARGLDRDDFRLTLVGGDTDTGPLGVSMAGMVELAVADDPRLGWKGAADRAGVEAAIAANDVVVVPSLWECGPYVALEALHLGRPVLATPVGGLTEIVVPDRTGWLAADSDPPALAAALEGVLDSLEGVERIIRSGEPIRHAARLCDRQAFLDGYCTLAAIKPRRRRNPPVHPSAPPLVSAIVPYHRAHRYVRATIESLLAQTYPRVEIVLVDDGSFAAEDAIVAELCARAPIVFVAQMNRGLGAARNLGISQARGRYVFPLDADNLAHPTFVARCVEILESQPELAYATSWSRYIAEDGAPRPGALGYQPLGNEPAELLAQEDVAGDAAAVIRRAVFDAGFRYSEELTACEDWHFYRELTAAGRFGTVIPERLLFYRVRDDSMQAEIGIPRRERILGELEAHLRENALRWSPVALSTEA